MGPSEVQQKDKRVTLRAGPSLAALSLTVSAEDLGCEMVYPEDALISMEAPEDIEYEYRFKLLHLALRALKDSQQTSLQVDHHGVLEIKMRFPGPAGANASSELFSQFFVYPLADDDEEVDATSFAETAAAL